MNEPLTVIRLDGRRRAFLPGDQLSGEFRLVGANPAELESAEVSVLWYTEGKGEEDLAVHFFDRIVSRDQATHDLSEPTRFRTVLPASPLSYDGRIVKIRWCVRVRLFFADGKSDAADAPFTLGAVPPPVVEVPAS